ncbi:MAG: hypothetical protein WC749_09265 [Dehalococcoidia bacterium]
MTIANLEGVSNLAHALSNRFSVEESAYLARVLSEACRRESITYEEIDIPPDWKDDIILLAYEERMLLPMKSLRSSAWEDRILSFTEKELYHLPRVMRFLVPRAEETSDWHPEYALAKVLQEAGDNRVQETIDFLSKLKTVAPRCKLEAGRMQSVGADLGLVIDMHDCIDRFVRCGIMSACTQSSLRSGLAEYEINRSIYWETP